MKRSHRLLALLALALLLGPTGRVLARTPAPAPEPAQAAGPAAPTVLVVAGERLTDLVLGYDGARQVARLGFGTAEQPWHAWYGGSPELQTLVHLPGYVAGHPVRPQATSLIGNRFAGKAWPDAFAALAAFDTDGNGIVEGAEMRELWIWVDFDGRGEMADREDALRPAAYYYGGFDLRPAATLRQGHARQARVRAFAAIRPYASRIHLLELEVGSRWATRLEAHLPAGTTPLVASSATGSPLAGRWHWKITNDADWKDATRPWGAEAGGQLLLTVAEGRVQGVVQYTGPYGDRINLPLAGRWDGARGEWTSRSPLGLARSEVRLESLYGRPVLRARTWSNRNGKLREWTWEARHDGPIE